MANRLIKEKSPYLLMHAYNPVDWYPWCNEAFLEAVKRNVPIFLSIGYTSCHWCHVMEEESFKDKETAEILNKNFISIKVDREELADVDNFYMEACQAFTGSGGWPLSAFLLHDKSPFFAGTYYPKEEGRYGNISFKSLLNNITKLWHNEKIKLIKSGKSFLDYITKSIKPSQNNEFSYDEIYKYVETASDKKYGGFKGAPKFPSASSLIFLLQYNEIKPESQAKQMLKLTLNSMETGGLFDHIGGGFYRYSTDEKWLIPHFEKMLYDNALLIYVYSAAAIKLDAKYEFTVRSIVNYLFSEMLCGCGGFYTSQDADSEGIEGRYYVFSPKQIVSVLGVAEGEKFCIDYDVTSKGNFEGLNIPNRIGKEPIYDDKRTEQILNYRKKRVAPLKDDKILTSSNGLLIAALSFAGRLLDEPKWVAQAEKTADFILNKLFLNDRLMSRYKEGETAFKGTLEDYAYLLWGLSELYDSTLNFKWLDIQIKLAKNAIKLFSDGSGGFYLTANDSDQLPVRLKKYFDGPIPSANAVLAQVFINLYQHTKEIEFKNCYEQILAGAKDVINSSPLGCFGLINAKMKEEFYVHAGLTTGEGQNDFIKKLKNYNPFLISTLYDSEYEKVFKGVAIKSEGKATLYICDNKGCQPPLSNADYL